MALEAQSIFWIVFFSIMLANIAHDMVVCVQQPMFTEMFGASYRYSGAGVGYQVASVVGVDLHLLLPLHSSLTLPGTGIASPFICWLDA